MKVYTHIKCEARNSQRLLNKFSEKNIDVFKVQIFDNKMSFRLEDSALKQAKEIMDKMAIEYSVESRGGKYLAGKMTLRYLSMIIPAILVVAVLAFLTKVCFTVEIIADNGQLREEISYILAENSVKPFTLKDKIDTSKLSYEISKNIDEVGFANCYFDGGVLKVEVKKVHVKEEQDVYDEIVADRDCIITKVLVFSGTALVKVGDVVKKGDVLIAGYVDSMPEDPENEDNERFIVNADGLVYGETSYTKQLVLTAQVVDSVRTGKSYSTTQIYLFGKPIGKQSAVKYEEYEYTQESKIFGSAIPIKAVTTTYYETVKQVVELDELAIDEQISLAYIELWQSLPQDGKLLNDYIYKKKVDNLHIIDIYLILE
ncbi:MAG: sporulation protein YqfD, partial [Clostridia bacterium]|nr:sporulation protein YqfD [Clostridia bacterium]